MKKISIAIPLGLLMMFFVGCSSAPDGTVAIKELQNTIEQRIGQEVVAVGAVDTNVGGMSMTGLFRLYRGNDSVWTSIPEGDPTPPQGVRVRVTGVVKAEEFPAGIGRIVHIEAKSIRME